MALAVVNLTKFGRVTQSGEDQEYFQHFAQDSSLDQTQQLLADSVYVLYNVQDAEAQTEQLKRDTLLNTVVVLLASLTLISVTVDSYNFIRQEEPLIEPRLQRVLFLLELVVAIALFATAIIVIFLRRRKRRRRIGRPQHAGLDD